MFQPTVQETQTRAYYRWKERGEINGNDLFDYYEAEHDVILAKNYEVATHYQLDGVPKKYFGDKNNRACRFCGGTKVGDPKVSFKNESHTIPEFMGNKSLISYDECDSCNALFSRNLENNLSEFILPLRTNFGMSGKTGIPTYKSIKSRIERAGDHFEIKQFESDPIVEMDQANNSITMPLTVKTYVPINIYKCLTKMAMSIMPDAVLPCFERARDWIRIPDPTINLACFKDQYCYLYFIPGPKPYEHAWVTLLRRRDDTALIPHVLFVIGTHNIIFMTFVPLSIKDDFLQDQIIHFPRLGLPAGPGYEFGTSTVIRMPLDTAEKVRGTKVNIKHHVDSFRKH